jgi:hypothetical protein
MATAVSDNIFMESDSTGQNSRDWKTNYSTANSKYHRGAHFVSQMSSAGSHTPQARASSPQSSASSLLSELDVDAMSDIRSIDVDSDEDMDDMGYDDADGGDDNDALGMDSSAMDVSG